MQLNSKHLFVFLNLNVQCITNKIDLLHYFLSTNNCSVAGLTEYWLTSNTQNMVVIQGYRLASCYSRKVFSHGGALILVKDSINFESLEYLNNLSVEKHIELAAIYLKQINAVVITIYHLSN